MHGISRKNRKVNIQIVIESLNKHGYETSLQEAALILEFIYDFANLALNQQLQKRSNRSVPPILHPGPG